MKPSALIAWSELEEARRRRHEGGMAALPGWLWAAGLGGLLAAEVARRVASAGPTSLVSAVSGASHLWFAAAVLALCTAILAAPYRLYWRRDSKLLASLPLRGQSLFALGLYRSSRAAIAIGIVLSVALVPMGIWGAWELVWRHALALAIALSGAAFLGPAAAMAAGSIVASDKAQAMIASMGGEFQAPKTTWLGLLPGLAATGASVGVIACAPWCLGARPPGGSIELIAALGIALPLAAVAWAWLRADAIVPAAVREVAALDQELLAHIDRSTPSALERATLSIVGGSAGSRRLATKDISLSRRRYPSPYFLIPVAVLALWIVALVQPGEYFTWFGVFLGGGLLYSLLMSERGMRAPVEIPSLLRTLPLSADEVVRAKRVVALLRVALLAIAGGIPVALRAPDVQAALVATALVTLLVGIGIVLRTQSAATRS